MAYTGDDLIDNFRKVQAQRREREQRIRDETRQTQLAEAQAEQSRIEERRQHLRNLNRISSMLNNLRIEPEARELIKELLGDQNVFTLLTTVEYEYGGTSDDAFTRRETGREYIVVNNIGLLGVSVITSNALNGSLALRTVSRKHQRDVDKLAANPGLVVQALFTLKDRGVDSPPEIDDLK